MAHLREGRAHSGGSAGHFLRGTVGRVRFSGALYDPPAMTIIIDKDQPVVAAALRRDGIESISFRLLSYEIASAEYAIALSYEMVDWDPAMPADDVLRDIRATLRRITRGAAPRYG